MKNTNKKSFANFTIKLFFMSLVFVLISCMPRGETKTIGEVYSRAHSDYLIALKTSKFEFTGGIEIRKTLMDIEASVQQLVSDSLNENNQKNNLQLKPILTKISDGLISLTVSAGYASRPAFGEITQQLEYLSQITSAGLTKDQTEIINSSSRRLLAARIYDLLTAEINGVGFALKARENKA